MNRKQLPLAAWTIAMLMLLAFVGCDSEVEILTKADAADLFQITATIPHDQQANVPLSSGIIIHFNENLNPVTVSGRVQIVDDQGEDASFEIEVQGASIVIKPDGLWKPRCQYTVTVAESVKSSDTARLLEPGHTFVFETGVRRPKASERLSVIKTLPSETDPCWDFQTFRIFFNEPVDRFSLVYGTSITLTRAADGEILGANVFAKSNQVVVDPHEDLTPGEDYILTVKPELKDYNGEGLLEDFAVTYTAKTTGNRVSLALEKCPTVIEGLSVCEALPEDNLFPQSKFLYQDINSMMADSLLLGPTDFKVGSRLWSEFGEGKLSPDRIPIVVRKGQKLYGKGIQGSVGGEIDSGVDTGEVVVTVLTDAMGELLGSEFVHGVPGLPATVTLTMDAVLAAENPTSSSILSQPIIGTTLVGQANIENIDQVEGYQTMEIELVGFAETELVNEYVPVTMALKMIPPPTLPEKEVDTDPLTVSSVSPVDFDIEFQGSVITFPNRKAGDEIIVAFDKPIDPNTVEGNIRLEDAFGKSIPGTYDVYPPKVAFKPLKVLDPDSTYYVVVETGITDLLGNHPEKSQSFLFKTMPAQSSDVDPPMITNLVPGIYDGATFPANFYPEVYFTQIIEESSLVYGDPDSAFESQQGNIALIDVTGGGELVPCTLVYLSTFVQLVPDFQFESGNQYRLAVGDTITNIDGVQLDTDRDREPGGPTLESTFSATPFTPYVQTMLSTYPYADTNVNGYIDGNEVEIDTNFMAMDMSGVPFVGGDYPSFTMGTFPIKIHAPITDAQGNPRLPIDIEPTGYIFGSNSPLELFAKSGGKADPPGLLDTGLISIQIVAPSSADLYPADDGLVGVDADTTMLFSVENQLINNMVDHDVVLKIPSHLRFSKDGRMCVIIRGESQVTMSVPILGSYDIPIDVDMLTSTLPSRRGF